MPQPCLPGFGSARPEVSASTSSIFFFTAVFDSSCAVFMRSPQNLDEVVKSRHTGENRCPVLCNYLKFLDTGFRRYDNFVEFPTFYGTINLKTIIYCHDGKGIGRGAPVCAPLLRANTQVFPCKYGFHPSDNFYDGIMIV
jgi:hypothetical protein